MNVAVYVVPVPPNPLSTPPATCTTSEPKSVIASLTVKLIVAVLVLAFNAVTLALRLNVGATMS